LEAVVSVADLIAQSLLVSRSDAIIAADCDGVICFWNPGADRIFGYMRGEAIGRSLDLIIPERLRQRHWDGYRATIATGRSRYGEGDVLSVPALHKNGTTISVEFTIVPMKNELGAMIGMAAIMRDVSKRFEEIRTLKRKLTEATEAKPTSQ
jgi:PAS domain S-box-containing protein